VGAEGPSAVAHNAEVHQVSAGTDRSARIAELKRWLRSWWPVPFRPWIRDRDLAVLYALVVLVVSLLVAVQPPRRLRMLVEQSSTNLANMADQPLAVLVLSAFVVAPVAGVVLLVPLVVAYGEVQRWLGRRSTFLIAVFGHIGATLMVMTVEITALHRHVVGFSVLVKPDVGVSYGLFAALGALVVRVPRSWRVAYGVVLAALVAVLLARFLDFTNLGHAFACLIGVCLGWMMHSATVARSVDVHATTGSANIHSKAN
jgi:hypothetical protein